MSNIEATDFEGMKAWAQNWINYTQSYDIAEPEMQVDFFGDGDSAYLVINCYTGENTCTEYIFLSEDEKNVGKRMVLIFNFLQTVDFSLGKLLNYLQSASYTEHEMGESIFTGGLEIKRVFHIFKNNAEKME